MTSTTIPRDYSLIGREAQKAKDKGLASATWYATPIPRKRMKELMRRSDQPAIRDTAIWLGLLMLTGGFGVYFWGTWWCVPFFFVYGILFQLFFPALKLIEKYQCLKILYFLIY